MNNSQKQYNNFKRTMMYFSLTLLGFFFAFPLLFMLVASLKPDLQTFTDLQSVNALLPTGHISLANYINVFENSHFGVLYFNSVFITATTVIAGLFVNSLIGYAMARLRFRGKSFLVMSVIALLIVPFEAIAIPMFTLVSKLPMFSFAGGFHISDTWLDSYHVQILPFVGNALFIFLFYQTFRDIPPAFDEAAYLDGANPWQVYYRIIVPVSIPVFSTVAILHSLLMWNQYMWPILTTSSEEYRPIMLGLQIFSTATGGLVNPWGTVMAYASMVTLPVLIVFIIFQRYFIQSVMSSGVK